MKNEQHFTHVKNCGSLNMVKQKIWKDEWAWRCAKINNYRLEIPCNDPECKAILSISLDEIANDYRVRKP